MSEYIPKVEEPFSWLALERSEYADGELDLETKGNEEIVTKGNIAEVKGPNIPEIWNGNEGIVTKGNIAEVKRPNIPEIWNGSNTLSEWVRQRKLSSLNTRTRNGTTTSQQQEIERQDVEILGGEGEGE